MIPIKYNDSKLKEYNDFIDTFLGNLDKCLNKGYVGNRNRWKVSEAKKFYKDLSAEQQTIFDNSAEFTLWQSLANNRTFLAADLPMDTNTVHFITKARRELKTWVNLCPKGIKELSNNLVVNYADFKNHSSTLYRVTYKLFVDEGYKKLPNDNLIEATGADVCPYCNRVFIKNVDGKDGKQVKGQLDHFYDKAQYPYLAILKYNLIPSCPFCNGPTGKHSKDAEEEGLVSPFMLESADTMKFHIDINGSDFVDMNACADAISIRITYNNTNDMKNNVRVFHIEELYNSHTDYAAEMYFRNLMRQSEAYKKFVSDLQLNMSSEDFHRMIFGFSNKEEDICKRPISKFCKDILEDLEKYT